MNNLKVSHIEIRDVACIVWHPDNARLICVTQDAASTKVNCIVLEVSESGFVTQNHLTVNDVFGVGQVRFVAHHNTKPFILLIFPTRLCVWDYESDLIISASDSLPQLHGGGFLHDEEKTWVLVEADSSNVDWGIWNYRSNKFSVYELERHDHYGRGAVLHPSGLLIGALWNAYECGYHIHDVQPTEERLFYFSQPSPERREYEAYEPTFSPDGRLFAFLVNPYTGWENYSKACVYDIMSANLVAEFDAGIGFDQKQFQFACGDKQLAFYREKANSLCVFDLNTQDFFAILQIPERISYFAAHRLYGLYAVAHKKGVTLYFDPNWVTTATRLDCKKVAIDIAGEFVINHKVHRIAVGKEEND